MQHSLSHVEHVVGPGAEGEQASGALQQWRCLRLDRETTEAPFGGRGCGKETLANRLDERGVTHMCSFGEQASNQIPFGVDGEQVVYFTYVSLDEICDRLVALRRDLLTLGYQVEDGVIDQGLNGYQKTAVCCGERPGSRLPFRVESYPLFDRHVQFFKLCRNLPR